MKGSGEMAKICRKCAKKGEKVYMEVARKTLSMVVYACPKCKKRVIVNRR